MAGGSKSQEDMDAHLALVVVGYWVHCFVLLLLVVWIFGCFTITFLLLTRLVFSRPIYRLRTFYFSFLFLLRRNSGPGSLSRGPSSSPLLTTVRAFSFTARRIQHFLSSLTRVELYTNTAHYCLTANLIIRRSSVFSRSRRHSSVPWSPVFPVTLISRCFVGTVKHMARLTRCV